MSGRSTKKTGSQKPEALAVFKRRRRRAAEKIVANHVIDQKTLRWLAIAWAKRKGFVPRELNRSDQHEHEIPFWVSDTVWGLQATRSVSPWHRQWRATLAGIIQRAGIEQVSIIDREAIYGTYMSSGDRIKGRWRWPEAMQTVNWLAEMGLLQAPPFAEELAAKVGTKKGVAMLQRRRQRAHPQEDGRLLEWSPSPPRTPGRRSAGRPSSGGNTKSTRPPPHSVDGWTRTRKRRACESHSVEST